MTAAAIPNGSGHHVSLSQRPSSPTSLLSLPDYRIQRREQRARFFYAANSTEEKREVLHGHVEQDPCIPGWAKWHRPLHSNGRSSVQAFMFNNEKDEQDWLASKERQLDNITTEDVVLKEYRLLQQIEHPHIVAAVGAYKDTVKSSTEDGDPEVYIGILLYPLCPGSLSKAIHVVSKHNAEERKATGRSWQAHRGAQNLLSFIPCLCHAVLHLHSQRIKHKDIKWDNILIDKLGAVILADFDLSDQYQNAQELISRNHIDGTPHWLPDSVSNQMPRGLDRDIVCLGFAFMGMATVLFGETTEEFVRFTKEKANLGPDSRPPPYRHSLKEGHLKEWIERLRTISHNEKERVTVTGHDVDGTLLADRFLDMIYKMMNAGLADQHMLEGAMHLFRQVYGHPCEFCAGNDAEVRMADKAKPLTVPASSAGPSRSTRAPEVPEQVPYTLATVVAEAAEQTGSPPQPTERIDTPRILIHRATFDDPTSDAEDEEARSATPITAGQASNPLTIEQRDKLEKSHVSPATSYDERLGQLAYESVPTSNNENGTASKTQLDSTCGGVRRATWIRIKSNHHLRSFIRGPLVCISYSPTRHKVTMTRLIGKSFVGRHAMVIKLPAQKDRAALYSYDYGSEHGNIVALRDRLSSRANMLYRLGCLRTLIVLDARENQNDKSK